MNRDHTVAAVGDAMISHRILVHDRPEDPQFQALCRLLGSVDVASVNLETNVFDLASFGGFPAAERGGSYLLGEPGVVDDLIGMGFTLFARANNHAGDWGIEGQLATTAELSRRRAAHSGIGRSMAEATRPAYLDTPNGRVAMISLTTTYPASHRAGEQRPDIIGRPGCNGVKVERSLELPSTTHAEIDAALAAYGSPGLLERRDLPIVAGTETRIVESLAAADVDRILAEIDKAAAFSDLVLVNGHTHEPDNHVVTPPDWLVEFARKCVDAGADAYLGHGPHQLRGMELHNDRPIFYSLGNFVSHRDTQDPVPGDQYPGHGLDAHTAQPHHYVAARDEGGGLLSMTGAVFHESVVATMRFTDGRLTGLALHPIELGVDRSPGSRGTPRLADPSHGAAILDRLNTLSDAFGFDFDTVAGVGTWPATT